jgi:hypothetical protein
MKPMLIAYELPQAEAGMEGLRTGMVTITGSPPFAMLKEVWVVIGVCALSRPEDSAVTGSRCQHSKLTIVVYSKFPIKLPRL